MDTQRVFLAIPIPDAVKQEIGQAIQKEIAAFKQARWIPQENWHVTILPPQHWTEDDIRYRMDVLQDRITQKLFSITLSKIELGPSKRNPRMVWVVGEPSVEYDSCVKQVISILRESEVEPERIKQDRENIVHITLARFPAVFSSRMEWTDKIINVQFLVDHMELWHVDLKRTGAEYTQIGSIQFANGK